MPRSTRCACCARRAGTTRLQLEHKGDYNHAYTNFANIVVAFAFLTIPVIGWQLDKKVGGRLLRQVLC